MALLCLLATACEESKEEVTVDEDIAVKPVVMISSVDDTDKIVFKGSGSSSDNGKIVSYEWSCSSSDIIFSDTKSDSTVVIIPESMDSRDVVISLKVEDSLTYNIDTIHYTFPELHKLRKWNISKTVEVKISNNVEYEWYIDQYNTGK